MPDKNKRQLKNAVFCFVQFISLLVLLCCVICLYCKVAKNQYTQMDVFILQFIATGVINFMFFKCRHQ